MAEPLRRMERAFFERLVLVRSGGDSIRRSMAASSFYAAMRPYKKSQTRRLVMFGSASLRLALLCIYLIRSMCPD